MILYWRVIKLVIIADNRDKYKNHIHLFRGKNDSESILHFAESLSIDCVILLNHKLSDVAKC